MFSAAAMMPLLAVGVAVMTLSLNLNGYVKSTESPIYVESIAKFAQPVSDLSYWSCFNRVMSRVILARAIFDYWLFGAQQHTFKSRIRKFT